MIAVKTATESAIIAAALVPMLFLTTLAIGRWLKRRQGVRIGFFYLLFCITFSIYVPLIFFGPALMPEPTATLPPPSLAQSETFKEVQKQLVDLTQKLEASRSQNPQGASLTTTPSSFHLDRAGIMRHIGAALALLTSIFAIALIRRYFWELWFERTQNIPAPKFLSQICAITLFVTAAIIVISFIYNKDLTAFVFGSTIVVGIIGFAMQDLLGNIISGIALEIGKPFKIGDWLIIDGYRAEVIEVNWRSTRLRTNDDIYLDLPNKSVAGSPLTNLTYPNRHHAVHIEVGFDYSVPPNLAKETLLRAAARAPGVLSTPPPKINLCNFADSAVTYDVKLWIENETVFNDICDAVRTNIWYEAQRNRLKIPFPIRTIHVERPNKNHDQTPQWARLSLLKQPLFQCLTEAHADKLLAHANLLRFGKGEKIIEQGEGGQSMFLLFHGDAEVFVRLNGHDKHVANLKTGDSFGEMSLLTGEPRSATVLARVDCDIWEIQKTVLAEILQDNKGLVEKLGALLAERRMETEGVLAANLPKTTMSAKQREYTDGILAKLYSFFEL